MILLDSELNGEEVAFTAKNVIKKGDLQRGLSRMYLLVKPDTGDQVDQQEVKAWANSNLGALENAPAQMGLESLLLEI